MKQKTVLLSVGMQPYLPAIALLTILFAAKENVIWGIAYPAVKGELAIQSFFRWHLLTIPPLLFASGYISTMRTMEVFIRVRVRSDKRLYRSLVLTCLAASSLWGLLLGWNRQQMPLEKGLDCQFSFHSGVGHAPDNIFFRGKENRQ